MFDYLESMFGRYSRYGSPLVNFMTLRFAFELLCLIFFFFGGNSAASSRIDFIWDLLLVGLFRSISSIYFYSSPCSLIDMSPVFLCWIVKKSSPFVFLSFLANSSSSLYPLIDLFYASLINLLFDSQPLIASSAVPVSGISPCY